MGTKSTKLKHTLKKMICCYPSDLINSNINSYDDGQNIYQ